MRILFTSCPAYGHVNPMLPLARQAQLAGHEVVFATGAELAHEVKRRNFETWLVGPSRAEADTSARAAHPNSVDLPAEQRMRVQIEGVFVEPAAKRAVELVPRAQQLRPDIFVH